MSQINVNVIAPLGYTGPALTGDNTNVGIINAAGYIILKTTTNDNTALGREALEIATGGLNTAIGGYALQLNTTGSENTAVGIAAGGGIINGTKSVFIGRTAGGYTQGGNENTVVGYEAGYGENPFGPNTGMGDNNTCVGSKAGRQITGGSGNTFIGWRAGDTTTTGDNNTCIGFDSSTSSLTVSNQFTLGNSSITTLRCAVQTIIGLSDARDKKDVAPIELGLDFVKELNPVKFVWDDRDENGKHDIVDSGFIAQDLKALEDKYDAADVLKLVYDDNPDKLEASYGRLIPVLVQAIKELTAKVELLENK